MTGRRLCMIFEATGPYNAIGKIAMAQVKAALAQGWHVSVVANRLCESLHDRVDWLKLYVPPRCFALQWLTARRFIKKAMGDPSRFDVIHGHQPQIADLCNIFQCHFLTRVAHERKCLEDGSGIRRRLNRIQKLAVLVAEDRHYSTWNPQTKMVFVSGLLQNEFKRIYGLPPNSDVIENAGPPANPVDEIERQRARKTLLGEVRGRWVVGFLGGTTERKGFSALRKAVLRDEQLHLLVGGAGTKGLQDVGLKDRLTSLGMVENTDQFYAACDLIAVPSIFDPCPYVVLEAVSRGVPAVVTEGVGNAESLVRQGAGVIWSSDQSFGDCVQKITNAQAEYSAAALRWSRAATLNTYCDAFIKIYDQIFDGKHGY